MKYFENHSNRGYSKEGITFGDRVFSIIKSDDGLVEIMEECDANFSIELEPQEAIEMFEEAIKYIKENWR